MNCSQARALLATYREFIPGHTDTAALDAHLATCAACREIYAQSQFIGDGLRAMAPLELAADARTRLMRALAEEHVRFMQQTPASTTPAVPTFLTPYVKDLAEQGARSDTLAAFAAADTGPLPAIHPLKHKRSLAMNPIAIVGLAASFLMVIMIGGLTSLLLLANQGPGPQSSPLSAAQLNANLNQVNEINYTTPATYAHVASAIADNDYIYYTTYSDDGTSWTLEQLNNKTQTSTQILPAVSTSPLFIVGSSPNWLVWLQFDAAKATEDPATHAMQVRADAPRTWSLHARFIGARPTNVPTTAPAANADIVLSHDTFAPDFVPNWVHTPVQGIEMTNTALLAALIDQKGVSHLWSYAIDTTKQQIATTPSELGSATNGHILTAPTANSDGTAIYWAEEWWSSQTNRLNSNIWTQQKTEAMPTSGGRWAAHLETSKYLFRADGSSFQPQVVQNMLFFLSAGATSSASKSAAATATLALTPSPTSTATAQGTATPTATPTPADTTNLLGGAVKIAPGIYPTQIDTTIAGKLLAFSANGALAFPSPESNSVLVSSLQGGTRFLLWQNSTKGFEMYDVVARAPVKIGESVVPKNADFLSVNGDAAVWTVNTDNTAASESNGTNAVTFGTFTWPIPIKSNTGS